MRQRSTVLGMAAAAAVSGASFSALAGACTTAKLSTYLSGGANATCTVLDKTITGMTFSANPSGDLPASSVTVDPVTVANDPGLKFTTNMGSGVSQSTTITFTIAAPPSSPMTDASVAIEGTIFEPGGAFSVSEMLSNNASLSASNGSPSGSTTFSPITSLTVTDSLSSHFGDWTQLTNQFSETSVTVPVPKPSPLASLALLGIGLSALELVRRRKGS